MEQKTSKGSVSKQQVCEREQLLGELMQWLSHIMATGRCPSVSITSDQLYGQVMPLLALVGPSFSTEKHSVFLKFTCLMLQNMNSEMVR